MSIKAIMAGRTRADLPGAAGLGLVAELLDAAAAAALVLEDRALAGGGLVPPGEAGAVRAAGGLLPLGLGGEALALRGAVGDGVVPGDPVDRLAGAVEVAVRGARAGAPARLLAGLVLGVRDLVEVHQECL
jgi:hypothetical protein